MAACRTVNVNMLWQQTLNQPLVTASWNNLKTCVTFWPNLGWCSTSLTRTEARTALVTSDFHYEPAVGPNVHLGWDRGCSGSAAPFGQECVSSQGIHWEILRAAFCFGTEKQWALLLLFTTAAGHQPPQDNPCQHLSWFSFAPQLSPWPWTVSHWTAPWGSSCSSAQSLHHSSVPGLLVQVCSWFEMCVKSLVLAQITVQLDVPSMWMGAGRVELALDLHWPAE